MNLTNELQILPTSFEIATEHDLLNINEVLRRVKVMIKYVEDELNPQIKKAHEAHKSLNVLKKKHLEPLENVEAKINTSLKNWQLKKDEEASLLQEKINADLAKKAEEYKQELLEEAKEADGWNQELLTEKAHGISPATVDLQDCKVTITPKVEGQYKRSNWKCRIIDWSLIPRELLIPNEKLLNKMAQEQKERFNVQGCESFDDFTVVTKG